MASQDPPQAEPGPELADSDARVALRRRFARTGTSTPNIRTTSRAKTPALAGAALLVLATSLLAGTDRGPSANRAFANDSHRGRAAGRDQLGPGRGADAVLATESLSPTGTGSRPAGSATPPGPSKIGPGLSTLDPSDPGPSKPGLSKSGWVGRASGGAPASHGRPDAAGLTHPASTPQALAGAHLYPAAAHVAPKVSVPKAPAGWQISAVHLGYRGQDRYYLVARPQRVTASRLPLLIVLPGRAMTPAHIEGSSGFLQWVGQAVVVYPDGYGESWNAGYCCGAAHRAGVNDIAFIEDVIASVLHSQPGTSARSVYLAGFSNGGRMALLMACADPGAFAGIAAVEAVPVSSCARTDPVPIIEIAQTGDPLLTIPADAPPKRIAGRTEITVDTLVGQWRDREGCSARPAVSSYAGGNLRVYSWTGCDRPGRVELAVYRGGAHRWPRGGPSEPSAQQLIWSFFDPARR